MRRLSDLCGGNSVWGTNTETNPVSFGWRERALGQKGIKNDGA